MEIGTNMRTAVDQCYINPWNSQKIEFSIVEPQKVGQEAFYAHIIAKGQ